MRVCLTTEHSRFEHLAVPLMGEHQAVNCGLALAMLDKLKLRGFAFQDNKALEGLSQMKLPGRLEVVSRDPHIIIDGAHNAASIQALFRGISQHIPYDSMVVIFGCNCDKDIDGMLEQISLGADKVIFTQSRLNPKAAPPAELASLYTERYGKMAQVAPTIHDAIDIAARAISREDLVAITGSFYLIGEAKQIFLETRRQPELTPPPATVPPAPYPARLRHTAFPRSAFRVARQESIPRIQPPPPPRPISSLSSPITFTEER